MANRKLTNANKATILLDWFNSPTNRADILYFTKSEVSGVETQRIAFDRGLLITISDYDNLTGKITFGEILT